MKKTKAIEVEGDELQLRKNKNNKYKLVKDFKGKPSHEKGGVDITAKEGDVIVPKKDRSKVLKMLDKGEVKDKSEFESYRQTLPEDEPVARQGTYIPPKIKGILPLFPKDIDTSPIDMSLPSIPTLSDPSKPLNPKGITTSYKAPSDYQFDEMTQVPNNFQTSPQNSSGDISKKSDMMGSLSDGFNKAAQLAPIIYNISQGLFGKVEKYNPVQFNPNLINYNDSSDPIRNQAKQATSQRNSSIRNLGAGSTANIRSNMQQSANQQVEQLANIENNEIMRKLQVEEQNQQIKTQTDMLNTEQREKARDINTKRRERKQQMLAEGLSQASDLAQTAMASKNQNKQLKGYDDSKMKMLDSLIPGFLSSLGK